MPRKKAPELTFQQHLATFLVREHGYGVLEQGEITDRTQEHLYEGDKVIIAYRKMLKEQIELVQRSGDPMNVIRDPAENIPWTPTLEGWPAATIEAATKLGRGRRGTATDYRFNFHKLSTGGWQYIEDDVDRYCPDRELILKLYEEADRVMQQQAPARQSGDGSQA